VPAQLGPAHDFTGLIKFCSRPTASTAQLCVVACPWPCWPDRPSPTRAPGYIGVAALGFNPPPPSPPSLLCVRRSLDFAVSTMCFGLDPCHLRLSLLCRCRLPASLPTTPFHRLPHPYTPTPSMWHSWPVREFPSSRSSTQAARFARCANRWRIQPPTRLSSGGSVVCC
jgi:hypothetical protein